jgi:hypothetical protein
MKYQHQAREYKPKTAGFTNYFKSLGKKNKFTAQKKKEDVVKAVRVDYFANKVRNFFISKYYAEKNWLNRNVLKQIIMLPVSIDFAFTNLKCKLGFHFHSKQQLVNAGIRPPKRREKYYQHCFVCGKGV